MRLDAVAGEVLIGILNRLLILLDRVAERAGPAEAHTLMEELISE
jgi:hypothetical protein